MAIVRAGRGSGGFTVLSNEVINDARLSFAARGLLHWILSKPDHWQVSVEGVKRHCQSQGKKRGNGRDAIYALLAELKEAGYMQVRQIRDAGGLMGEMDYLVTDTPTHRAPGTAEPHTDEPHTDKPDTAEPYTVNPTQVNTEVNQELNNSKDSATPPHPPEKPKRAKRAVSSFDAAAMELPGWMPKQSWLDFVAHRAGKKAPLTELAATKAIKQLEALRQQGDDIGAVIDQSILSGWSGLFALNGGSQSTKRESRHTPSSSFEGARKLAGGRA